MVKGVLVVQRTYSAKPTEVNRKWYVVDAEGKTLGRLASTIAATLRGKHKPIFTPHIDTGDFVVVVNAEKIKVTGNKETQKFYYRHSNYPGGLKTQSLKDLRERHPDRILENAVKGMLPRNTLGKAQLTKLKIYAGAEHPHAAQNPVTLELDDTATR
jgi:large subunit ribosomal protein L13